MKTDVRRRLTAQRLSRGFRDRGRFDASRAARLTCWLLIAPAIMLGCNRASPPPSEETAAALPSQSAGNRPSDIASAPKTVSLSAKHATGASRAETLPQVTSDLFRAELATQRELLDPVGQGWKSEETANQISSQLKRIGHLLSDPKGGEKAAPADLVAAEFECRPLRPAPLEEVFRDAAVVVRRPASSEPPSAGPFRGPAGLMTAIGELAKGLQGATQVRTKFKVFRIADAAPRVRATSYVEASGRTEQGTASQTATWETEWVAGQGDGPPRLVGIAIRDYEEVEATATGGTVLADCTAAVFGDAPAFRDQVRYGAGYWMRRLPMYISPRMPESHMGLAVGDANGDGREDVYLCQPGGLPNRLFIQQPDGTVVDQAAEAGVDVMDWSCSGLFVDLDNDGDQDLVAVTDAMVVVFANDGSGHFRVATRLKGSYEYAVSAADYDQDGDLDLYLCNYFLEFTTGVSLIGRRDPLFNSNMGGQNALFRNDGDWKFTDVTVESGLDEHNSRLSFAAAWEDYDNDGDLDLYVVNDFGHNSLYQNDGAVPPHFKDVAEQAGIVDANQGMSVSWADYNHDGLMDLYVSNMFSSAGNRVMFQERFKPGVSDATRERLLRLARGNTLFKNAGDGTFRDVSDQMGVTMGRWAWGSLFADINNDGWDDLLVTNGYLSQADSHDL
ncbi:MAG: FG-GAP repeat domain-containing protein [Pirellulales bacterium]